MNNSVEIRGNRIEAKEINGQRVVSFKDIDLVHQRPNGTARRNFNNNSKFFINGEDYIILTPANAKLYEIRTIENLSQRGTTFLTESGYLMLVKSFTDDLAWNVQRQLVNNYFRVKQEPTQLSIEPVYELQRKTYGGITVMTFDEVAYLLGVSKAMAYYRVKQYDIHYKVLCGQELIRFKEENKGVLGSLSTISIFYSEDAIKLCECMDVSMNFVYEYFGFVPTTKTDTPKKKEETLNDMDIKKLELAIKVLPYLTEDYRSYISSVIVTRMMGQKVVENYGFTLQVRRFLDEIDKLDLDIEDIREIRKAQCNDKLNTEAKAFMDRLWDKVEGRIYNKVR